MSFRTTSRGTSGHPRHEVLLDRVDDGIGHTLCRATVDLPDDVSGHAPASLSPLVGPRKRTLYSLDDVLEAVSRVEGLGSHQLPVVLPADVLQCPALTLAQ